MKDLTHKALTFLSLQSSHLLLTDVCISVILNVNEINIVRLFAAQ